MLSHTINRETTDLLEAAKKKDWKQFDSLLVQADFANSNNVTREVDGERVDGVICDNNGTAEEVLKCKELRKCFESLLMKRREFLGIEIRHVKAVCSKSVDHYMIEKGMNRLYKMMGGLPHWCSSEK